DEAVAYLPVGKVHAERPALEFLSESHRSPLLRAVHVPGADVHEVAFDCGGGSHQRAHQMRAAAFALAALEVAIRRAGRAFARRQNVVIHADAHAATGVAPLESGVEENLVQTFVFGFDFYAARA